MKRGHRIFILLLAIMETSVVLAEFNGASLYILVELLAIL